MSFAELKISIILISYRYYELKGNLSPQRDAREGQEYDRPRTAEATNFIRNSVRAHGEIQNNSGLVMLPTCYPFKSMYEDYVGSHSNPYCYKHFKRLLKERFPLVKASEVF